MCCPPCDEGVFGALACEGAEHYLGMGRRAKRVAPTLQSYMATRVKEKTEVEKQRNQARGARKLAANPKAKAQKGQKGQEGSADG